MATTIIFMAVCTYDPRTMISETALLDYSQATIPFLNHNVLLNSSHTYITHISLPCVANFLYPSGSRSSNTFFKSMLYVI